MTNRCIDAFQAQCIYEPRGDHGLEGYQLDKLYDVELMSEDKDGKEYYRVYLFAERWEWETCSKTIFNRYFKRYI